MSTELQDRAEHATARPHDVALLRSLLEEGRELTKDEARRRWRLPDRRFRAAISELRHAGYPVVSISAAGSTYRKAHDEAEVEAFVRSEVLSRATDLFEQARAMRRDAASYFHPIQQELIQRGRTPVT